MEPRIRPVALAVVRRGDEILVEQGRDGTKDETFFRLLGGGIDFGERGADALRRELDEELGAQAAVERYLGMLENIFTYEGEERHEIVLVYECSFRDHRPYALEEWKTSERSAGGPKEHRFAWKRVDSFVGGGEILYPDGVAALVEQSAPSR